MDKSGQAESFKCTLEGSPLSAKVFEKLEDGKGSSALLPFDLCYGLLKGHWYDIKVHLKYTPHSREGLPGRAFLDEVVAPTIRFQYQGPDPVDVYMKSLSAPSATPPVHHDPGVVPTR